MLAEEGNLISSGASIIRATSNGDADAVRAVLAEGVDVDQRGRGGHTALMVAAIFSHVDIARLLLAAGADVTLRDSLGLTARDWANRRGSWEVAQLLSDASPSEIEPSKQTVETSLSDQEADRGPQPGIPAEVVAATRSPTDTTHSQLGEAPLESATEAKSSPQPDAIRFKKFHKQIMAAQERRKAEQASRETDLQASPIETKNSLEAVAPSVVHEQKTISAKSERRDKEARPTAAQSARIAATIEHLRLQEESIQPAEDEAPMESDLPAQTVSDRGLDTYEPDTTLDHVAIEASTRPAMIKPKMVEPLTPSPSKRCPKCNTTYENPMLVYCAYDAAKLIGVDDSLFDSPAARDWSRQTLWALVAIIALLGASLGYLINNYRSTEKVPSAPIAAVSTSTVAIQTEQPPEVTRSGSPLISGELSGMEVDVPEPEYPAMARAEGVSGAVKVRVQVNKRGRVVLARSSAGDWRLRAAAVKAAQKATFSPEKLAEHDRVVSGTITYTFVAQTESAAATQPEAPAPADSASANGSSSANGSPVENVGGDYPVVGGPLVGAENNLPQPGYPEKAKSKGIQGAVTVVVRVNRAGKVISWRTLEGDSQLRAAALTAAKKATFSPNKLPGTGEVVGTITYNFKP